MVYLIPTVNISYFSLFPVLQWYLWVVVYSFYQKLKIEKNQSYQISSIDSWFFNLMFNRIQFSCFILRHFVYFYFRFESQSLMGRLTISSGGSQMFLRIRESMKQFHEVKCLFWGRCVMNSLVKKLLRSRESHFSLIYNKVMSFTRCCCCFSMQTGAFIIGFFELVIVSTFLFAQLN